MHHPVHERYLSFYNNYMKINTKTTWLLSLMVGVLSLLHPYIEGADASPSVASVSNPAAFIRPDGTFHVRNVPAFINWLPREGTINLFKPGPQLTYRSRVVTQNGQLGISASSFQIPLNDFSGNPEPVDSPPILFGAAVANITVNLLVSASPDTLSQDQTTQLTVDRPSISPLILVPSTLPVMCALRRCRPPAWSSLTRDQNIPPLSLLQSMMVWPAPLTSPWSTPSLVLPMMASRIGGVFSMDSIPIIPVLQCKIPMATV
jgi:hypothetical protein